MTTEQTWTRDDQDRVKHDAVNGLPATRQETIAMLAEIERTWGEIERLTRAPDPDRVQAVTAALLQHGANRVDAPAFARVAVEAMGPEQASRPAPLTWSQAVSIALALAPDGDITEQARTVVRLAGGPAPLTADVATLATAIRDRIWADNRLTVEAIAEILAPHLTPAPLTEAEAEAWALSLEAKLGLDCPSFPGAYTGPLTAALLASNRGDIPADVRPPEKGAK